MKKNVEETSEMRINLIVNPDSLIFKDRRNRNKAGQGQNLFLAVVVKFLK